MAWLSSVSAHDACIDGPSLHALAWTQAEVLALMKERDEARRLHEQKVREEQQQKQQAQAHEQQGAEETAS